MISFALSEIIALVVEALAYGMYLILFFASLSVAFSRRKAKRGFGNKFLATALLLFVLITWHLAIDSAMLFLAYSNETTAEADLYYINGTPGTLNVMKTALYVATTLVSDAFMLYRCFVVWNYSIPIIVFPTLCLLAGIGTGITGLIGLSHTTTSFFIKDQLNVVSAFFGMTMATNGIATALIAIRVWRGQRQISGIATGSSLSNLLVIILESGAIYSAMLILVLALFLSKNTPGYNVVVDATSSIIGIVFSLIIVRIGLNLSVKSDGRPEDNHSTLLLNTSFTMAPRRPPTDRAFELKLGTNVASTGASTVGPDFDSKDPEVMSSSGNGEYLAR
ncbi:hypothetical protein C8F04DRAFT_1133993 [Mycena alexandri]|uniref:Uncharacterized protein n=1 Tax=Mycena alexandri TaxID=1745969 RepID=A0AAD6S989_9AGAR|nr:hypothetical protein C8F04DRAFT_1133993 [Mycena alexandri]